MLKTTEQNIIKFIRENNLLEEGDRVLVALSGGPDSVFLFEFLLKYNRTFKIEIATFHLNHNLRGKESVLDEKFCRRCTSEKNIRYYSSSRNVKLFAKKNKISVEEAGREIRYAELLKCADKINFNKIATAHIADDNTETVLLNLIKGTGLKGLAGIPVKRGKIIRPLLAISKKEILEYLHKKNTEYRMDKSNLENDYERNFLRNEVIPLIGEKLNPQFNNAVFRNSEILRNVSSYLEDRILSTINETTRTSSKQLIVDLDKLKNFDARLHSIFLKEVLNRHFEKELDSKNIHDIEELITKQPGKEIILSNGLKAVRERDSIIFCREKPVKSESKTLIKIGGKIRIEKKSFSINQIPISKVRFGNSAMREYISADNLKGDLIIRTWENGDRFYPLGMKNSKKISDFLNEQKVDSYKKKDQLVLTNSGNIIWVVGLRIDDRYKITDETKKVLKLCMVQ